MTTDTRTDNVVCFLRRIYDDGHAWLIGAKIPKHMHCSSWKWFPKAHLPPPTKNYYGASHKEFNQFLNIAQCLWRTSVRTGRRGFYCRCRVSINSNEAVTCVSMIVFFNTRVITADLSLASSLLRHLGKYLKCQMACQFDIAEIRGIWCFHILLKVMFIRSDYIMINVKKKVVSQLATSFKLIRVSTITCRYNAVEFITILHTTLR